MVLVFGDDLRRKRVAFATYILACLCGVATFAVMSPGVSPADCWGLCFRAHRL